MPAQPECVEGVFDVNGCAAAEGVHAVWPGLVDEGDHD